MFGRMWLPFVLACTDEPGLKTDDQPSDEPPGEPGAILVLCGGGTEGEDEDPDAWSAVAYGDLLANGDVTGDGLVTVAVLATGEESEWVPTYFEWLGADDAFNLRISSVTRADDEELIDTFAAVDAVFLKGGDQGEYYDRWNGTTLEAAIRGVLERGGGVGGTSAGAMSLSEYALAGSSDLVSSDVLTDSRTSFLDDVSDGGTGIHDDFLGFLPGALVDTHFSTRGRLGRLAGVLARAIDDGAPGDLLGIGLDEQTCITVRDGRASVSGVGSVVFLRPPAEPPLRVAGEPLAWADLALDRLTEGWVYDLEADATDLTAPAGEAVAWDGAVTTQRPGDWSGTDEERFAWVIERRPHAYAVRAGTGDPLLADAFGILDAHDSSRRGVNDEVAFRALHDHLGVTGFLLGDGGGMERVDEERMDGTRVVFTGMAALVLDASGVTWRSLSPSVSPADAGDGGLSAAGLVGVRLHVLYSDGGDPRGYDLTAHRPR